MISFFILIQASPTLAWVDLELDIRSACAAYYSPQQQSCSSKTLDITLLGFSYLICQANNGTQSIITAYGTAQYFIAFNLDQVFIYQLPTNCAPSFVRPFAYNLTNFGIASSAEFIYLFGGLNSTGHEQGQLISVSKQSLILMQQPNFSNLAPNYISKLEVNLTLWDKSTEIFPFLSQMPNLLDLKNIEKEYNITIANDTGCDSPLVPGCIKDPTLVYQEETSCLYLFFGKRKKSLVMQTWVYHTKESVWQKIYHNTAYVKVSSNPRGALLTGIGPQFVGFYADQKYFFYDIAKREWIDSGNIISFANQAVHFFAADNITYIQNQTHLKFSSFVSSDQVQEQLYGLVTCKEGFDGKDCAADHRGCFAFCISNLLYKDICVECSGHGTCVNGKCECVDGYTGDDCGVQNKCGDGCGKGTCEIYFPISQCQCPRNQKLGGDDCKKLFCLNECSGRGDCNSNGECECNEHFTGEDCSILLSAIT